MPAPDTTSDTTRTTTIGRRVATAAAGAGVAAVTVLAAATPAFASTPAPFVSPNGEATIVLDNDDATWFAIYDFYHSNQVCQSITDTVNATRQAQGQTLGLSTGACVNDLINCVHAERTNVQIYIAGDNRYTCSQYLTDGNLLAAWLTSLQP